jgi:hypothetical protein
MSGVLERLADLASRTLATARSTRPAHWHDEQATEAPPDAALEPTLGDSYPADVATPELRDRTSVPRGDPTASWRREPDAAGLQMATDEARPAPRGSGGSALRPTEDGPTGPTAQAKTPTIEKRGLDNDIAIAPPAGPARDARPSLPYRDAAAQAPGRLPAPAPGSGIPRAAGGDQTVSVPRPGLLRDAEISVVSAADAVPGGPVARGAGDALPHLQERWRELGARLRATHPPTAPGAGPEEAGNGEAPLRPEAAEPPTAAIARHPRQPAPVEPTAAQRRSELIIRHLEIRIVAPAKETAPAAEGPSPAPLAGAWQTAARRYLRL